MPNKYQEAFNRLSFNFGLDCLDKDLYKGEIEDFKLFQELVDKATSKKPILSEIYLNDEDQTDIYDENGYIDPNVCCCPNCKKSKIYDFEYSEKFNYCTFCGQRIDWSDEDVD